MEKRKFWCLQWTRFSGMGETSRTITVPSMLSKASEMENKYFLWAQLKLEYKFPGIECIPTKGWIGGGMPASSQGNQPPTRNPPPESWGGFIAWHITRVISPTRDSIQYLPLSIASEPMVGGILFLCKFCVLRTPACPLLRLRFRLPWPFATDALNAHTLIWFSSLEKKLSIFAFPNRVQPTEYTPPCKALIWLTSRQSRLNGFLY